MRFRFPLLAMITVSLCFAPAAAEQPSVTRSEPQRVGSHWEQRIECSAAVSEGARLVVRADLGSISVKPGRNDRMECELLLRAHTPDEAKAKRYFESFQVNLRTLEGGGVYLSAGLRGESYRSMRLGHEFHVSVPLRFNVDVETQAGNVEVERLEGELAAVTAGGNIRAGNLKGPVKAQTAGGNINLGNTGARVEARTAGGNIDVSDVKGDATLETSGGGIVAGQISGTLRAETAGGDMILRGAAGPIEARTAGGQIKIGESAGSVRAQTAGGSIRLLGPRGRLEVMTAGGSIDLWKIRSAVQAATAAGGILAQIDPAEKTFSPCVLQSAVGDVLVYVPPNLPLTVDAVIDGAAGHRIISDFPIQIQGEREAFVQRTLRGYGELNGGGEVLKIRTVSGNIEIRKLDPPTLEQLKERLESFWKRQEGRELRHRHDQD